MLKKNLVQLFLNAKIMKTKEGFNFESIICFHNEMWNRKYLVHLEYLIFNYISKSHFKRKTLLKNKWKEKVNKKIKQIQTVEEG